MIESSFTLNRIPNGLRVFLAEDDADDRFLFEHAVRLHFPDWECQSFEDGSALLEALEKTSSYPYAIFLDFNMPGMSGPEVYRILQQHSGWAAIPVIILTGMAEEWDAMAREHHVRAELWRQKPNSMPQLVAIIRQQLAG